MHFSIDIWTGKPWPQVFCVPAMDKIPWRWRMLMCRVACRRHVHTGGGAWEVYQKELHSSFPYRLNLTARTCDRLFATWAVSFWSLVFLDNWKRLSRWQGGLGLVGVVLLVTSVEEWTTQALGFIYLGLNCDELPLKIRQLVVEQVSGTLRPEGDVLRSQLASACPSQSITFPILPPDGATPDL